MLYKANFTTSMNFNPTVTGPIDVRTVVDTLASLASNKTWAGTYLYAGMQVAVVEAGKESIWYIPNVTVKTALDNYFASADYTDPQQAITEEEIEALGWKKLAINDDVIAEIEAIKTSLTATGISYTRTGVEDVSNVKQALDDLYDGLASAGKVEGIKDLQNQVSALDKTVNGDETTGTKSLQEQITDLDSKVEAIDHFKVEVVDSKPVTGTPNTIYLVPAEGGTEKEEYLWINGAWELIGTTHVSLKGYAKTEDVSKDIATAKSEAIAAATATAAEDATSKANTAESNAITEATKLANAAQAAAIATAAEDATSKANTAESNAKAYTDSELSSAKTELEGTISALTTRVTTNEGQLSTLGTKVGENTDAIAGINTTLEGVAKQAELDSAVSRISANETNIGKNTDAIAAINNGETGIFAQAKNYIDTALENHVTEADLATLRGTVQSNSNSITGINANITELSGKVATIESSYATTSYADDKASAAQSAAIEAAASDATSKANKALDDAKAYTDSEITTLGIADYAKTSEVTAAISAAETTIQGKLDKKVESSEYEAKVAELEKSIDDASAAATTAEENAKAYTNTEFGKLDTAIKAIKTFSVEIPEDGKLPEEGKDKVIYLIPEVDAEGKDLGTKAEYLWVNGGWELIGTTHVSLTDYATTEYVDGKASAAESAAIAAAKTETTTQVGEAKTELTTAIGTAKSEAITTAASDATSKADNALKDAKAYTDTKVAEVTPNSLAGTPEKKASWKSLLSFVEADEVNVVTYKNKDEPGINGVEVASTEVIKYYSIPANIATSITVSSTAISKLSFFGTTASVEMTIDGANGEAVYESVIGDADWSISGETPAVLITSKVAGTLKVSYIKEA